MTDNILGDKLRTYRLRAGKSVAALAVEVGVERTYLHKLEGQPSDWLNRPLEGGPFKQPSRDLVIRLAIALHLSVDDSDDLPMCAGYAPLLRMWSA